MAWQVAWTESAWNDLEGLADYIAQDSPFYAASFVREVRTAARSLKVFAERGRIVPEFNQSDVRELLIGQYRLIYKIAEKTIYILTFVHGARDLEKLWARK